MDDFKLLRRFVEADSQAAFSELVARHINLVHSVCLRETQDAALAQDVTQAVFLILFHKAPGIRRGTVLAGWLFHTARLASRNARRGEMRRRAMEQVLADNMAHSESQDAHWSAIEPLLHEALASLRAKDRDAILLRYFQDRSLREIAQALGTTEKAAQMRVARALEKLRKYLQAHGVAAPLTILGAVLLENAVQAAPASCAQASVAAIFSSSATAKSHLISQEVLKSMFVSKLKAASLVAALGVASVVGAAYFSGVVPGRAAEAARPIPTPNPAWPSGVAILRRSKAAYGALSIYVGKTSVHDESIEDGEKSESSATADIQFRRPNLLHVEGQLASEGTYKITFDGGLAQVDVDSYGKQDVDYYPSPESAVNAMTGIAAQAPTLIPSALMGFQRTPFVEVKDAKVEGQEDIDGAQCDRISITLPHDKKTFWVDAKTSLLRRYKREQDQIDMRAEFSKRGRTLPLDYYVPESYSSTAVHDFAIESAS